MKGWVILDRTLCEGKLTWNWQRHFFKKWYVSEEAAIEALKQSKPMEGFKVTSGDKITNYTVEYKIFEFNIEL